MTISLEATPPAVAGTSSAIDQQLAAVIGTKAAPPVVVKAVWVERTTSSPLSTKYVSR